MSLKDIAAIICAGMALASGAAAVYSYWNRDIEQTAVHGSAAFLWLIASYGFAKGNIGLALGSLLLSALIDTISLAKKLKS